MRHGRRAAIAPLVACAIVAALALIATGASVACSASPPPRPSAAPARPSSPDHLGVAAAELAPPASTSPAARGVSRVGGAIDPSFLRAYTATRRFRLGTPQRMLPTPDGKSVLFLRSGPRDPTQSLFETDLASGHTREILSPSRVLKGAESLSAQERARRERMRITTGGFTGFDVSRDGTRVLLTLSGRLYVLTRASGDVRELPTGAGAVIDPHFSHDGRHVAYVRGNEVHSMSLEKPVEVAVTRGATETRTHGLAEFIAEEELSRHSGFWWSPDGARLLYEEADTSRVELLSIVDLAHPERAPEHNPYPRAGKPNAELKFGVVSARGGATTWIRWDHRRYPYAATVRWDADGPPTMYVLDRLQQHGLLLAVDPDTGNTRTLVEEHDDAFLNVDISVPRWLPKEGWFLWSSERDGAWRLELRDRSGKLLMPIGTTALGYRALLDVSPTRREAVVSASAEPSEAGVYRLPIDGGPASVVAHVGGAGGVILATFGRGHDVFASYEGAREGEPWYVARSLDGKIAQAIPSVAEAPGVTPVVEIERVGADEVRVGIVRPRGFDPSRRYAVIDAAYGGPHATVTVADSSRYLFNQWLANAVDAVVVSIDARGTPFRGRDWERAIYKKLGSVPVDGHVAALKALGATHRELDLDRVGVFGWSFGGYFAARAALAAPETYKAAMAGAPVVDWRDYDTCYTERYLGLPADSAAAYDAASVMMLAGAVDSARVRPLLLVHGTADDNVYFLNSLKLADALARRGASFELMPLSGITHQLAEPAAAEAVWARTAEFFREHLAAK